MVWFLKGCVCGLFIVCLACSHGAVRYEYVERSLIQGHPEVADRVIEQSQDRYRAQDRLLYVMDRGMTLHLAGRYRESITYLDEAIRLVEQLYTKHMRDEARALLVNDRELPYEGEPYEHIMIHVLQALNYALVDEIDEALVEARNIDHRLNVLSDARDPDEYHEDPFARYLTGLLYEAAGDLTNAYVAYRKAERAYQKARPWLKIPVPTLLQQDLLWITQALGLDNEYAMYRTRYPDVPERPVVAGGASLVLVSFVGRAPRKEEQVVDVPLSLDALQLVVLAKQVRGRGSHRVRIGEAALYGLYGKIVRVALPEIVPQPSRVARNHLSLHNGSHHYHGYTMRMYDLGAVAKKNLEDTYPALLVRAAARVALKMGLAEGIGYGVNAAVHRDEDQWIGALVAAIARIVALATEEADTRSWRLLPGEIQMARLWMPAGSYQVRIESIDHVGRKIDGERIFEINVAPGQTRFLTHRILD